MKKNIILISYSYPPLNVPAAQRPFALAKYLDKSKYNITVITCKNPMSYFGFNKDFDSTLEDVSVIKIDSLVGSKETDNKVDNGININVDIKKKGVVSRIKKTIFDLGQTMVFPDRGMFWYPKVKAYLDENPELINKSDVVISLSPMINNHRIGRYIKTKKSSIKWIADFSDFHYVDGWEYKKGIKKNLHKRLEKSIIKGATNINFVTKTMLNAYQKFYADDSKKMKCVYNGFDHADFPDNIDKLQDNQILTFFYAGTFYDGLRSPFPLLQLLDRAIKENLIDSGKIKIQIAGNIEAQIKLEMENYLSFQCIDFLGSLPRAEVVKYMVKSTFLWLIVANIKSHYQTIPIKLFEYIAARRPIVNFAPEISEPSQIIDEKKLGYNFNTLDFDIDKSYSIFKTMINDFKNDKFLEPLSEEGLDEFTWQKQIKILENILQ
jgi:glycosyltransferase involved in cell wall biosynthesis